MDLKDLKKKWFIASRFCNFYFDKEKTVLRGIPLSKGYLFNVVLPSEKIDTYSKAYGHYNAAVSYIIIGSILLYIYLGVFPNYLKILSLTPIMMDLVLIVFPILFCLGTLYLAGLFLEIYIERFVGTFKAIPFKPTLYNIDRDSFNRYSENSSVSKLVIQFMAMAILLMLFCSPLLALNLQLKSKKYNSAIKSANVYLALNPLPARVYAMRAFAKYNVKDYKGAVGDYQKANDYSLSDNYVSDKFIVMTRFLDPKNMIEEFDKAIDAQKDKASKYLFTYAKANYQYQIKDYENALKNYNIVMGAYKNNEKVLFQPSELYLRRAKTYSKLGNFTSAQGDMSAAESLCPECNYGKFTENQLLTEPSF